MSDNDNENIIKEEASITSRDQPQSVTVILMKILRLRTVTKSKERLNDNDPFFIDNSK